MINDYVVQWSTANRDNVAAQLMGSEIIPVANQNQASHLLVTLLDVMERARRAPTLLESLEVLFTAHCVSLAQAAVRPARITAAIRIDASATSSRRFRRCFRVLLNASRVNTTAPEDHRLIEKRSCKRRDSNERPNYQNVSFSLSSAASFFDWSQFHCFSLLRLVIPFLTLFYGNDGTKFSE